MVEIESRDYDCEAEMPGESRLKLLGFRALGLLGGGRAIDGQIMWDQIKDDIAKAIGRYPEKESIDELEMRDNF